MLEEKEEESLITKSPKNFDKWLTDHVWFFSKNSKDGKTY